LALVPFFAVSGIFWWFNPTADPLVRWLFTAVAVPRLGLGIVLRRQVRKPVPPCPGKEEAPGR
jgi:hypothetical protein